MALTDDEKKYLLNRMNSLANKVSLGDLVIDGGGGGSGADTELSNLTSPTAINQDLTFAAGDKSIKAADDLTIENTTSGAQLIVGTDGKIFARSDVENAFVVSHSSSSSDGGIYFRPQSGVNMTYIQGGNGDGTGGGDIHIQQGGGNLKIGNAGSSRIEINGGLSHTNYEVFDSGATIGPQGPAVAILDMDTAGGNLDLPLGPNGLTVSIGLKGSGGATWTLVPFGSDTLDDNLPASVTEAVRIIYISNVWYRIG